MRITPRGAGLLVATALLLGAGFAFGYPELTVLGSTAGVALVVAVGYVAWRPRLSVVRSTDPDRVMRGEASRVTLTVSNASRMRAATLIAYDRCGPTAVEVPVLRLRAGRTTTVDYLVPTDRRGVVPIGPLQVVRRDPLGLLTMPRTHGGIEHVWVYPRVHPLTAVPPGIARSLDGLVDRVPHGSITFDTLREYVIGDELRHVHWRTTARVGQLMVREHVDTSLPRLVVLLDDRIEAYRAAPDGAEAFEAACEAAASIVLAARAGDLPVALQLVSGQTVVTAARDRDTRAYLDLLAEVALGGDDLTPVTNLLRHRSLGDTLIFLTGPGRPDDLGQVGTLRGAYPTLAVVTFGTAEPTLAAMEGVLVLAAEDGADFAAGWDGVSRW